MRPMTPIAFLVVASQRPYLATSLTLRHSFLPIRNCGRGGVLYGDARSESIPAAVKPLWKDSDSQGEGVRTSTYRTYTAIAATATAVIEDVDVDADADADADGNRELENNLKLSEIDSNSRARDSSSYAERTIQITKLDWYMRTKTVEERLLSLIQQEIEIDLKDGDENDVHSNVNARIYVAPKSNKKRDADKNNGGRALITLPTKSEANLVMEKLRMRYENIGEEDAFYIGSVNLQWATPKAMQKLLEIKMEERVKPGTGGNGDDVDDDFLNRSESKILHRKRRAEKYARQRQKIGLKTDQAIASINEYLGIDTDPTSSSSYGDNDNIDTIDAPPLDWSSSSAAIDPIRGGGLKHGSERGQRKHAQVEAFVHVLKEALLDVSGDTYLEERRKSYKTTVADLGSGAGNLSLPLAWFLNQGQPWANSNDRDPNAVDDQSNINILAVDINKRALERLKHRASEIDQLEDVVDTLVEDISNFVQFKADTDTNTNGNVACNDPLDECSAIVSLHACGAASDLAIAAAVQRSIPFAVSPCCIGKVKSTRRKVMNPEDQLQLRQAKIGMPSLSLSATQRSAAPKSIIYPRSEALQTYEARHSTATGVESNYNLIVNAADYNPPPDYGKVDAGSRSQSEVEEQVSHQRRRGRMAKRIVETDRLKWAEEQGYQVRMMEIPRMGTNYPKREILLGAKAGSLASSRISQLSSTRLCAKKFDGDDDYDAADQRVANDDGMDERVNAMGEKSYEERMDLGGFVGYLAPYALALVLSIGVTAAFVKFVLLDY